MSFVKNIVELTEQNQYYCKEVVTGKHSQVVLMSIPVGHDVGEETHSDVDQVLVFVSGEGEAVINGQRSPIKPNTLVFVPAGTKHNFINTGYIDLKLYTIYSPPEHAPGTVQKTKAEADAAEAASHHSAS